MIGDPVDRAVRGVFAFLYGAIVTAEEGVCGQIRPASERYCRMSERLAALESRRMPRR